MSHEGVDLAPGLNSDNGLLVGVIRYEEPLLGLIFLNPLVVANLLLL